MIPKIISIIAVWDEQQMIGLSIASTKDIVYQYIILIKKGTSDKTIEVIKYCEKLWNLNMIILESELKLRDRRKRGIDISKKYADFYLIQDGDEIYRDTNSILKLISDGYTFCYTSIIFLEKDLLHTPKDENLVWLIPHPFLFKNTKDIFWPKSGDMPCCNINMYRHNIYNTGEKNNPFKFDCKIKNFKRIFLREVFTEWHESDYKGTIEEFADENHHTVKWYRENIDKNLSLDEIIEKYNIFLNSNEEEKFKWHEIYDENKYIPYPDIIKKFISFGKLEGIKNIEDLHYLDQL